MLPPGPTGPGQLSERFPQRATEWQLRSMTLRFAARPLLMGIINVTPDSFSDGGLFLESGAATEHAWQLAQAGADILDIGGESTRPYSTPVSPEEELRRVMPVVKAVCEQIPLPVSIDTSKSLVAREALKSGAQIINDVTGLEGDRAMIEVAAEQEAGVCAMHMQGTPQTMQDRPHYQDVVQEIYDYLAARRDALIAAGIDRRRIALDPGIGFGKTHQHNLTLLAHCGRFHNLGCPILVGHSRKGFLDKVLKHHARTTRVRPWGSSRSSSALPQDTGPDPRTAATIGVALALAAQGVQVLRVHDVRPVREALILFDAVGGIEGHAAMLPE